MRSIKYFVTRFLIYQREAHLFILSSIMLWYISLINKRGKMFLNYSYCKLHQMCNNIFYCRLDCVSSPNGISRDEHLYANTYPGSCGLHVFLFRISEFH